IRSLLDLAQAKKLDGVVVPVRPSAKVRHPWVSISEYLSWTDVKGRPYDPWLRSHLSVGGKIVGPCERSMVVHEPIALWPTMRCGHNGDTSGALRAAPTARATASPRNVSQSGPSKRNITSAASASSERWAMLMRVI